MIDDGKGLENVPLFLPLSIGPQANIIRLQGDEKLLRFFLENPVVCKETFVPTTQVQPVGTFDGQRKPLRRRQTDKSFALC